jgi:multicomponent Na+:H+ antiporter subunit G
MQLFISAMLITIGTVFIVIAGLGLVRMPDLFLRMSASTKAATLGVGCTLLGVALFFGDFVTFIRAGAIIIFLLLTAPVAAHLIGRAAYQDGVPLWHGTQFDDLRRHYEPASRQGHEASTVKAGSTPIGRPGETAPQESG